MRLSTIVSLLAVAVLTSCSPAHAPATSSGTPTPAGTLAQQPVDDDQLDAGVRASGLGAGVGAGGVVERGHQHPQARQPAGVG